MKAKKLITGMLLIVIFMAQISIIPFNGSNVVYAEEVENPNNTKFHYQQLDDVAKSIYNGICDMHTQGILKTGTETFDLAADDKYVTQAQLEAYMKGSTELKTAMNAARYAFYADYPEVFYMHFQKLNLRVTKDGQNRYHANIGPGSLKDYYVDGFTSKEQVESAITEFNSKVDEIVEKANNIQVDANKNRTVEQIKFVHDEIVNHTGYRLETDCQPGNEGFIGTPYGALVKGEAVCEGYARSFKIILDRLGINCILVQGTHQNEGSAAVPHMWTYVEIEKETKDASLVSSFARTFARETEKAWYAVDITLDDPFLRIYIGPDHDRYPGDDIEEGFENTRYCLVGQETMNQEHIALETVEAAGNYVFTYPELEVEDYGMGTAINVNGLVVKYKQEGTQTEEYQAGDYFVSYNGKGWAEAAKGGHYLLMKSYYYMPGDEKWDVSKWAYLDPAPYAGGFKDLGDHMYLIIPNSEYVEFAVTTLAPPPHDSSSLDDLYYHGDESDFVAKTEKLYNPSGTFKGRPYIKTQTPAATATLSVGPTYHVDVTYTDTLVFAEGATEVGYKMTSTGATGAEKSEITNFKFDGTNRITFDLKFSQMYADDGANYKIYITGLVGKNSRKEPMEISYGAINPILCSFRMNKAKNWEVFARPSLLENEDLSMNGWKTSDGSEVSDKLKSRIALVATRTTEEDKEKMTDLMEDKLPSQDLVTSETYNISLNVCKKYVVKTGHRLRLSVGFPAGYGPEDAGVTFKAYHFMRNAKGEVTGVEEIPCVITPYGLVITCDAFSPFAIAVVEKGEEQTAQDKAVIVSASEGGSISGANREEGNIFTLAEGESKELTVQAEEGYQIETLTIGGEPVNMAQRTNAEKEQMTATVSYDDIKDGNCMVEATFVANEVVEKEQERGEVVVQTEITPATATIPADKTANLSKELVIESEVVTPAEGILTYQWYKDGVKLEGKTNKNLTIDATSKEDSGKYVLKVTTTVGIQSKETQTNECTVAVRGLGLSIEATDQTADLTKLQPQSEFELDVNIAEVTNIGNGIVSLTGQLEYDTNLLEMVSITGKNGWNLENDNINMTNFKLVTDNNTPIAEAGKIFTIKFKVKDGIANAANTTVKVKGVTASGGYGVIETADVAFELGVAPEKETVTSTDYTIVEDDQVISKIQAETKVAQFKAKLTTDHEIVVLDKDGNPVDDNALLATGMTVKVGKTLRYTAIVTGDINGDGKVLINDLAKAKLHVIDYEELTGASLKAADVDHDGKITINDVAQIKLSLIDLLELK